jgi:hypothetical protein
MLHPGYQPTDVVPDVAGVQQLLGAVTEAGLKAHQDRRGLTGILFDRRVERKLLTRWGAFPDRLPFL